MPVILIMTDGLRPDAMSPERTPNLWAVIDRGAATLSARSVNPSITLPCHTSIFHSVPPSRHGIVENIWHPMARPVPGLVDQLNLHEKRSGFVHNWEFLRDLNRPGSLHYSFFMNTGYDLDGDAIITDTALDIINRGLLEFVFVYFASVDVAGHIFGWMSDEYLAQAAQVDTLVGRLLAGIPDDVTAIIHSDHGGHERTHGLDIPEDMTIPWMITGPGVRQGHRIGMDVSLLDTAPTIAHLLDVPPAQDWEGRVVSEAFA